jgi:hypothetical protein
VVSDEGHGDNDLGASQSTVELTVPNSSYPELRLGSTVFASGKLIMLFGTLKLY